MVTTIDSYTVRPKRTFQEDGLWDMLGGITLFAIALINYAGILCIASMHGTDFHISRAYQDANNFFIFAIFMANVMIAVGFHAVEPLKRRFVYPRLGYVQPRVAPQNRRQTILLTSFLIGIVHIVGFKLATSGSLNFWTSNMSLITIGAGIGVGLVINYLKVGFARHLIIAGISIIASFLLVLAHLDWLHASFWLAIILGMSLMVSGAVPFMKILRTPLITEGDTE